MKGNIFLTTVKQRLECRQTGIKAYIDYPKSEDFDWPEKKINCNKVWFIVIFLTSESQN